MNANQKDKIPTVSVFMPSYNQEHLIAESIESVINQTYEDWELVISDDCSTDATFEVAQHYQERFPNKIKLFRNSTNLGITENCNVLLKQCVGKYIAFTAGDDIFLPEKLAVQVNFMEENTDCTICYHNLDVFDSESNSTLHYFNDKIKLDGDVRTTIRYGTFNGGCSNLVRTDKIPKYGYDKSLLVASDWLFWIETLSNGGTISYINEVLGRYRRHSKNTTKSSKKFGQNELDHLVACQILFAKYPEYWSDIAFRYSGLIRSARFKLPYFDAVWTSFKLKPNLRSLTQLFLFTISLSSIKL